MNDLETIKSWLLHQQKNSLKQKNKFKRNKGHIVIINEADGNNKFSNIEKLVSEFQKNALRIDLSKIVSKYIGETVKNLDEIFKKAENTDVILFFDEAEALFGKRTEVKDSHDRYANREIKWILKKLEQYPGLIILSTNLRNNIDAAFLRRLRFIIGYQ